MIKSNADHEQLVHAQNDCNYLRDKCNRLGEEIHSLKDKLEASQAELHETTAAQLVSQTQQYHSL